MESKLRPIKLINFIFDVDGFEIDGKFLTKELAIVNLKTKEVKSYTFKVGEFSELSKKNKKTVLWLTKNVHGLRFEDSPNDRPQSEVYDIVYEYCLKALLNDQFIGYKGGHYEKDILEHLNHGSLGVNIESYGCPKVEKLVDEESKKYMCDKHVSDNVHCPKVEVFCFMRYLQSLLN